jgi:uncharacterized membrane protein YheB (UPF0754 family)
MDFISAAILSGIVYDTLKQGVSVTSEIIKDKLKEWVITEEVSKAITSEIHKLELTDEMSESAIEKRINNSPELQSILSEIKRETNIKITNQYHTGSGDNVAGNKIIN